MKTKSTPKVKLKFNLKNELQWYSFILPSIICLLVLTYWPTLTSLKYSFYKTTVLGFGETFVGVKNYEILLSSSLFYKACLNTLVLVAIGLCVIPLGFLLATLVNSLGRTKSQGFFRVGFYLPNIVAGVSVVMVFQFVLREYGGLLNSAISMIAGQEVAIGWLSDPYLSKIGASIISIWGGMGYTMLICLAGLQSVSAEIYEAAEIDGCGAIKKWLYITIPNMKSTFVFLFITGVISGFSRFSDLYILSGNSASGKPAGSLQSILMYIYQYSFESPNYGLSSAGVMILFVMVIVVTLINIKCTKLLKDD